MDLVWLAHPLAKAPSYLRIMWVLCLLFVLTITRGADLLQSLYWTWLIIEGCILAIFLWIVIPEDNVNLTSIVLTIRIMWMLIGVTMVGLILSRGFRSITMSGGVVLAWVGCYVVGLFVYALWINRLFFCRLLQACKQPQQRSLQVEMLEENLREDVMCPICLQVPIVGEVIMTLPCAHIFHQDCLQRWSEIASTCPICRGAFII
jgi:hypothetical protein